MSAHRNTEPGSDHRHPGIHRGGAQPGLHHRLGRRQFGARVDPGQFFRRRLDRRDAPALGTCQSDDIGEVVFALGVVGAHRAQPARHVGRRRAQHARIAQGLGAFRLRRVDPFDDALDIAVARDHAAVAPGVGRPERQQRQHRVASGAAVEQPAKRLRADQRVVGIQHGHLAVAELGHRDQCRVRGAARLLLHHGDMRLGFPPHRVHLRTHHDDDAVECLLAACQQMAQHGAAGDPVQGLGQRRFHARAQPGCQDHGGARHRHLSFLRRYCGGGCYAVSKPDAILRVQIRFRSTTP